MITYFIKSGLCLALLLAFYHWFLEREKMHTFNRFYLLASVLFSFLVPFFIIYIKVPQVAEITTPMFSSEIFIPNEVTVNEPINYTPFFIGFYILISLVFAVRFGKNLMTLIKKINTNQQIKFKNAKLVLVDDTISPHSFWNYIFINKEEYFNEKLEHELYTHELTHVTQKHTFDILLIEILQIVFWINPILYFLKKAIQLNHEFLADNSVINTYKNIKNYQYLLLNKSYKNEYYLASNLTYLLTKKRLQMMTKQSSKTIILLKKLVILPLIAGFIFLFAERVEAIENNIENTNFDLIFSDEKKKSQDTIKNEAAYKAYFYRKSIITFTDKNGKKISKKYNELTDEEKKKVVAPPPINGIKKVPSIRLLNKLKDKKTYAIWIDGKLVDNSVLNNYKNTDFAHYLGSKVYKNARSKRFNQPYQFSLETKKYFNQKIAKRNQDFKNYKERNKTVSEFKKSSAKINQQVVINSAVPSKKGGTQSVTKNNKLILENIKLPISKVNDTLPPKKASSKIVAAYNTLAKKYNNQPKNSQKVLLKDVRRINFLYKKLTKEQKLTAEPFPKFPPPPPSPIIKNGKNLNGDFVPPPPPSPVIKNGKNINGGFVPPPPPIIPENVIHEKIAKNPQGNPDILEVITEKPYKPQPKKGKVLINNKIYYYRIQNGKKLYFNLKGQQVDTNGHLISIKNSRKKETATVDKINEILSLAKKDLKGISFSLNDKPIQKSELNKIIPNKIKLIKVNNNLKSINAYTK